MSLRHFFCCVGITLKTGFSPWLYSLLYKNDVSVRSVAYLIVKISEREGELLALWDTSDAEIKPSLVVVDIFYVRLAVLRDPEIKLVFVCASIGS